MPLANLTAVANLALDHLGEPYLTDYATDTGTTADAMRIHLPQSVETVLEGHVWSFATTSTELEAAAEVPPGLYGSAFDLPNDCLRVIRINGIDLDEPRNDFEIRGRLLLLLEADATAPVIDYITNSVLSSPNDWPTTFTDAVAWLLASRLAPKLAQDQAMAGEFLRLHDMALGKARSKDARESRSKENFGPRQLAARSGLVRARFGSNLPPFQ